MGQTSEADPIHVLLPTWRYVSGDSTPISYSMIVLYSRDHKDLGVAHEKTLTKNQPPFPLTTMRQYWLGKTKPKQVFRSTRNAFNKLLQN